MHPGRPRGRWSGARGVWRRLVARPLWERKVVGSNPATPTRCCARAAGGTERLPRIGAAPGRHTGRVLHLQISVPAALTAGVVEVLERAPAVSSLAVLDGASRRPAGDVVLADIAREAANDVLDELLELGVQREGTVQIEPVGHVGVPVRLRRRATGPGQQRRRGGVGRGHAARLRRFRAELDVPELHVPGHHARRHRHRPRLPDPGHRRHDPRTGVRPGRRARGGPGPRAGTCSASRCGHCCWASSSAIAVTTVAALVARSLGWITESDITAPRPDTAVRLHPRQVVVHRRAHRRRGRGALADVGTVGGLSGVFISVTTVPAAGNIALGLAFWQLSEVRGSALQLGLNVTGMAPRRVAHAAVPEDRVEPVRRAARASAGAAPAAALSLQESGGIRADRPGS